MRDLGYCFVASECEGLGWKVTGCFVDFFRYLALNLLWKRERLLVQADLTTKIVNANGAKKWPLKICKKLNIVLKKVHHAEL